MPTETKFPEMTLQEIETQFDGEWVLVGDPELNEYFEVVRGKVLCHSHNRNDVDDFMSSPEAREFKLTATLCNRDVPRGMAVLL